MKINDGSYLDPDLYPVLVYHGTNGHSSMFIRGVNKNHATGRYGTGFYVSNDIETYNE